MADPRRHHYLFAHRALPSLVFTQPTRFVQTLRENGDTFLMSVWDRVGADLKRKERVDPAGLSFELTESDLGTLALIELPPARGDAEAHFVAVVIDAAEEPPQYFTLERATSPITHEVYNVLGAWKKDRGHFNLGEGPPTDRQAFRDAVLRAARAT